MLIKKLGFSVAILFLLSIKNFDAFPFKAAPSNNISDWTYGNVIM
jgi:hypothetical protein